MKKYFNSPNSLEELRKQYKELLKKLHPDNPQGSTEATQAINAEYDSLFKSMKDRHEHKRTDGTGQADTSYDNMKWDFAEDEKLREMLSKIISYDGIRIEIIGNWLWCFGSYGVSERAERAWF